MVVGYVLLCANASDIRVRANQMLVSSYPSTLHDSTFSSEIMQYDFKETVQVANLSDM